MRDSSRFSIWSDNWWIESGKAWFIWGEKNILCCLDLLTYKCELISCIPESAYNRFRGHPVCIKYKNNIYCMPVYGSHIWVYNTISNAFNEICINGLDIVKNIRDFWVYNEKIYAVSNGLKQVIELDLLELRITNYYTINSKTDIEQSIKVGSIIFMLLGKTSEICQFDLNTKEMRVYKISDTKRNYRTICYDGSKYWMSGDCKEVYVWDREKGLVNIITNFPENFGLYDFSEKTYGKVDSKTYEYEQSTFIHSTVIGQNVWFIPYCTNEIIYVNKETYQIQEFEIEEENETKESISGRSALRYKYLFECVKDNQYLILYSIKNNCILQIDTLDLKYEYKKYKYFISDKCVNEYANLCNRIFHDSNMWEIEVYRKMKLEKENMRSINIDIGGEIYKNIVMK